MSDEQERRRDPRPDETARYEPIDDGDDDRTRVGGIHPDDGHRSSDTRAWDDADETRQMPRDGTAVMPAADQSRADQSRADQSRADQNWADGDWSRREPAWSGRAEVRAPQPGGYTTTTSDWEAAPPPTEPGGRWWMPIVLGIVGLLLLGVLGWGIYLIAQNSSDDEPGPAPSPTAPATTEPATEAPTTEPTTEEPTTEPTTEAPADTTVTVPALEGLSQQEAQQALDRSGLTYRLIFRQSDAAPGTVIDSDPSEGQEVPQDTQVALVIARAATEQPSAPPTE